MFFLNFVFFLRDMCQSSLANYKMMRAMVYGGRVVSVTSIEVITGVVSDVRTGC